MYTLEVACLDGLHNNGAQFFIKNKDPHTIYSVLLNVIADRLRDFVSNIEEGVIKPGYNPWESFTIHRLEITSHRKFVIPSASILKKSYDWEYKCHEYKKELYYWHLDNDHPIINPFIFMLLEINPKMLHSGEYQFFHYFFLWKLKEVVSFEKDIESHLTDQTPIREVAKYLMKKLSSPNQK